MAAPATLTHSLRRYHCTPLHYHPIKGDKLGIGLSGPINARRTRPSRRLVQSIEAAPLAGRLAASIDRSFQSLHTRGYTPWGPDAVMSTLDLA
jgi:hypothetical protein